MTYEVPVPFGGAERRTPLQSPDTRLAADAPPAGVQRRVDAALPAAATLAAAAVLALFVIQPLWQPGLPGTADAPIHFYRTLEFASSYAPGILYPRWAPHLAYGYGVPFWVFVPPLPYILPLPFWAAGLSLEASLKATVMLTALGYALGAYLFVRDRLGARAGLVGAAVYALAPFALREVLLYGGNYPQYIAIGLFPWILWAVGRLGRRDSWLNFALTAVLFGAVILSHLFHALVLAPVAAAYALVLWLSGCRELRSLRSLAATAAGLGLGLAWTAFFWLPALVERQWTHAVEDRYLDVSPITLRFLDARELLALPQPLDAASANPWAPLTLGPVILLLAAVGFAAMLRRRSWAVVGSGMFFLAVTAICVFMMLPASLWLWLNLPFLAVAEFPWRLLGLANLCLGFLAGGVCLPSHSNRCRVSRSLWARVWGVRESLAILAVLLGSAVYLYPVRPFERYGERLADLAAFELSTRTTGLTTLGEYLPHWVEKMPASSPLAEALASGAPPDTIEKLDRTLLPAGARAQRLQHTAAGEAYRVESRQAFQARFLTFYFPGWQAELDGRPAPITTEAETGLITVSVPAGSHELGLWFADTPLRRAADATSIAAAGVLVLVSLWRGARRVLRSPRSLRGRRDAKEQGAGSRKQEARSEERGARSEKRGALLTTLCSLLSTSYVAVILLAVFLLKVLLIDPHTGWFRRQSPPGQVIGAQHDLRLDLDGRFWLLGYDLSSEQVSQGGTLQVVLYWQAQALTSTNYRPFVHLDAPTDERTWAISDNFHPGDATAQIDLPTGTWDMTHYVRDEHRLLIPPDVPPVAFNLRAGLYDPETGARVPLSDGSDTVALQRVRVMPGRGLRPDELPNRTDYRLGENIRLLGYAWDDAGRALTLYWQTERPQTVEVVVFVHLLDPQDNLAWGADAPPLGGLYPATAWQPGSVVADPHSLSSPAAGGPAPGTYTLAVGMYDPTTVARLPVTDAAGQPAPGDAIRLMTLTVQNKHE